MEENVDPNSPQLEKYKVERDNRKKYLDIAEQIINGNLSDKMILQNAFWSIWRGQESSDYKETVRGIVVPKQRRP